MSTPYDRRLFRVYEKCVFPRKQHSIFSPRNTEHIHVSLTFGFHTVLKKSIIRCVQSVRLLSNSYCVVRDRFVKSLCALSLLVNRVVTQQVIYAGYDVFPTTIGQRSPWTTTTNRTAFALKRINWKLSGRPERVGGFLRLTKYTI